MAKEYDDIPGTFVFDADRSREGYHLNMFCISLRLAENREAFAADAEGYMGKYPMTEEQRQAVRDRAWNRMLELGGNIYYTFKICPPDLLATMTATMSAIDFIIGKMPPQILPQKYDEIFFS